jgi:hypothetical protein
MHLEQNKVGGHGQDWANRVDSMTDEIMPKETLKDACGPKGLRDNLREAFGKVE